MIGHQCGIGEGLTPIISHQLIEGTTAHILLNVYPGLSFVHTLKYLTSLLLQVQCFKGAGSWTPTNLVLKAYPEDRPFIL